MIYWAQATAGTTAHPHPAGADAVARWEDSKWTFLGSIPPDATLHLAAAKQHGHQENKICLDSAWVEMYSYIQQKQFFITSCKLQLQFASFIN